MTVPFSVRGRLGAASVGSEDESEGRLFGRRHLREAEVQKLDARFRQHDVPGLQVPMDDAVPVSRLESFGDLDSELQDLIRRERTLLQPFREALPFEQLHDEEVDAVLAADVMERADVRVGERGDRPGFPLEALAQLGIFREVTRQHLDRDGPLEPRVLGLVDLPHPARAEGSEDFIGTEAHARGEAQEFSCGRDSILSTRTRAVVRSCLGRRPARSSGSECLSVLPSRFGFPSGFGRENRSSRPADFRRRSRCLIPSRARPHTETPPSMTDPRSRNRWSALPSPDPCKARGDGGRLFGVMVDTLV